MMFKNKIMLIIFSIQGLFVFGQTDSLSLLCPLDNGVPRVIRASDKDYQKSSEYGVIFTSKTDTVVKAVHDAQVVIVARTEDTKYDVVLLYKDLYFWYAGVSAPKVRVGARLKAGTVIGTYNPGDLLELLMFELEEPVNPRQFLKCNL